MRMVVGGLTASSCHYLEVHTEACSSNLGFVSHSWPTVKLDTKSRRYPDAPILPACSGRARGGSDAEATLGRIAN